MADFDITQVLENYDKLTAKFKIDLATEFKAGRIKGTEYADTYQKLMAQSMQEAMQTPLLAAQVEQLTKQNEKLDLEKDLLTCEISKCEATTNAIISEMTIKEAQSDKDLLIKAEEINKAREEVQRIIALTDNTLGKTTIEAEQSAKDLLIKDEQIKKYKADVLLSDANEKNVRSRTLIQEEQSAKDLLVKDKDIDTKTAQISFTNRQTAGFDDAANQKLYDASMNAWSLAYSSGMLSGEDIPSPVTDAQLTALYGCIKKSC
jgi:hypothetical protein